MQFFDVHFVYHRQFFKNWTLISLLKRFYLFHRTFFIYGIILFLTANIFASNGDGMQQYSTESAPLVRTVSAPATFNIASFGGVITAPDFLKLLNHRLKYEEYQPPILDRSQCEKQEDLIHVLFHGGGGQAINILVYDPGHLLMDGQKFNPSEHNHLSTDSARNGTRRVGFYSVDGEKFCIKEAPEAPIIERYVQLLNVNLFGVNDIGVPNSTTIAMNGKSYTVSRYVNGNNLDAIIRDIEAQGTGTKPAASIKLPASIENLHEMIVLKILAVPEDGRPQNYILVQVTIGDKTVDYLVSIDNERSLGNAVPHPSSSDPRVMIRPHCVTYSGIYSLLAGSGSTGYSKLKSKLLTQTPEAICENLRKQVEVEYRYHLTLFQITGEQIQLPDTKIIFERLQRKLNIIFKGLRDDKPLPDIFMDTDPDLAQLYSTPITPPTVSRRIAPVAPFSAPAHNTPVTASVVIGGPSFSVPAPLLVPAHNSSVTPPVVSRNTTLLVLAPLSVIDHNSPVTSSADDSDDSDDSTKIFIKRIKKTDEGRMSIAAAPPSAEFCDLYADYFGDVMKRKGQLPKQPTRSRTDFSKRKREFNDIF